ncbi:MAG: hypothetical protein BWK78_04230 [Thiotrichaceae bacterium IS1]|nr:MAG: hypothetical protein BWK78_04230 [Thiotrichaceae bacterium IS1]
MKTNNLVPTENHFKIILDLQVPNLMVSRFSQEDIQTAVNRFFQQHPQMLSRALETFGSTTALEQRLPTPLHRVTKRQRETLLATLAKTPWPFEEANSAQWIEEIHASRHDRDDYPTLFNDPLVR